jgi:alpha-ribazole phosphatase
VLILVRHGRTELNATGRLVGRLDPALDEIGLAQAAAIGNALKGADRVISSPLRRTLQTAEQIGVPVEIDDRWIEIDYGKYDGVTLGSPESVELWQHWQDDFAYVPPGGESLRHVADRVAAAVEDLIEAATDADVVVVSHVSPIKAAVSWALDAGTGTVWRSHLDQGSICRVAFTPRGPILRSFNETWHLAK